MKHAILQFIAVFKRQKSQRAGQLFVNTYLQVPWPELYHETDERKALGMIKQWLDDHQCVSLDALPKFIT